MEKEKFDPKGEQYKEVADLPIEEQDEFANVEGGFITKKAEKVSNEHEFVADIWNMRKNVLSKLFGAEITSADVAKTEASKINNIKEAIKSGTGVEAMTELFKESKYYDHAYQGHFTSDNFIAFRAFKQSVQEYPEVAKQAIGIYLKDGGENNYDRAYRMLEMLIKFNYVDYKFFDESIDKFIENHFF